MFFFATTKMVKILPWKFLFLVVPQPGNYIIYIAPGLDVRSTYQVICNQLEIVNQHATCGMVNQLRCSKLELNKIGWKYAGWIIATLHDLIPKRLLEKGPSPYFRIQIQAVDLWNLSPRNIVLFKIKKISQTDRPLFTWWGNPSNLEQHCPPFVAAAFRSFSPPWIGAKAMSMFRVKEPHPTVAEWFSHVR